MSIKFMSAAIAPATVMVGASFILTVEAEYRPLSWMELEGESLTFMQLDQKALAWQRFESGLWIC
ncbi:MAG: hypothetical protein VB035_09870 [Candidatus Fimivivens sp.]|nr:hypothetical protein [Candidatus Fimivivens sp.]